MKSRWIFKRMGGGALYWYCKEAAGLLAVALVAVRHVGVGVELNYEDSRQSVSVVAVVFLVDQPLMIVFFFLPDF